MRFGFLVLLAVLLFSCNKETPATVATDVQVDVTALAGEATSVVAPSPVTASVAVTPATK
jgi:hypothetical protein